MRDTLTPSIVPGIVPTSIPNKRDRLPDDLESEPHFGNADDDVAPKKPEDGEPEQTKPV